MKKTLLKIFVLCMVVCSTLFVFTACGESPISFKLNFIADNEIVKTIDTTGNEKIALPENPVKDGYAFDGWFWDKDVWEKPFTANSLLDAPLSSDMSVYAKFTKNHEHNYTATVTAPTCTEKGYTTYTCECGDSYKSDYVDKLEHEFTNYVSDNNATYDSDGTKTAYCNHGCGATDTITDAGTKLQSGIVFKTLNVDKDLNVYGKVPNTQATLSFINEVEVKGNATFVVSTDIYGIHQIPTKTVPIEIGDNTVYITETVGNNIRLFTVVVRRKPVYTVSFNTDGGTTVASQQVEEDSFATEPTTTKAGYTFIEWDYNFDNPITNNTVITAGWTANTNTPYKVEYYLQNLEDDNYTLYETENLTGTTDTTATAEIKTYEHFTILESTASTSVKPDGTTVLQVCYTRNKYTVEILKDVGISLTLNVNGQYKYGYVIPELTATVNIGYDLSWYSDDKFLTNNYTIPSFTVNKETHYSAKCTVKAEMSNFNFSSTSNSCTILGIKDKTVTKIIVPDYVTCIKRNTFIGTNLSVLNYTGTIDQWCQIDFDVLLHPDYSVHSPLHYAKHLYINDKLVTEVNINTATKISYGAFEGCISITSVVIGDNVSDIGNWAFYGCSALTSVSIGNGVINIGESAFERCESLINISIPSGIKTIKDKVFDRCAALQSITFSENVTKIGMCAFYYCTSLTTIIFNGKAEKWQAISKGESWKNNIPLDCVVRCTDYTINISNA